MTVRRVLLLSSSVFVLAVGVVLFRSYEEERGETYLDVIIRVRKYHNKGFIYRALRDSAKAIEIAPDKVEPYFVKIDCLVQMLDFEKVPALLTKLEELCTTQHEKDILDNVTAYYNEKKKLHESYLETHDNAKLIKPFLISMYENDVQILHNTIFYNNYGVRGVWVTKDVDEGEVIASVPENMIIFAGKSRKWLVEKYAKEDNKSPEEIKKLLLKLYKKGTFALGLYILENQNEDRFRTFIDIINSNDYSSFPLCFDDKTLALLKDTDFEKSYIRLKNALDHDYKILYQIPSVKKKYDLNTLQNIYLAVSSRNFGWDFSGSHDMLIVPYIDMGNHSSDPNTTWYYDEQKDCFCLKATKNLKKGMEVFDTYGRSKSNAKMLLGYGFCLDDNVKNDEVIIEYPMYKKRGSATIFLGNKEYTCRKNTNTVENEFPRLLNESMKGILNDDKKISLIEASREAMKTVNKLAKEKLSKYSDTLPNDQLLLSEQRQNLTFNEHNCYLVRIGEKSVLQWVIDFTDYCRKILVQCKSIDDLGKFLKEKKINTDVKQFFTTSELFRDLLKDIR